LAEFFIKRHDLLPPILATLVDENSTPVNITGATVKAILKLKNPPLVISGPCVVSDAANGEVDFYWQPGDTDVSGTYKLEFEAIMPDGKPRTFPNDEADNPEVKISNDLG
jgi:hypothetical protein